MDGGRKIFPLKIRGMAHRVVLKPSGHAFEVPDGQSILQAGLDAGYQLPYSCREGVCRTCRGTIHEGKVDYGNVHPTYLPDADKAKGYALLCQAKPLGDLVVEVHELQGLAGIRPRKIPCRVERLEKPAPDVAVLGLKLPANDSRADRRDRHFTGYGGSSAGNPEAVPH